MTLPSDGPIPTGSLPGGSLPGGPIPGSTVPSGQIRTEPVLACAGVRRSFPVGERRLEILHGINLELRAGERLALMGTSGAGKTTLLHILGLLDRPTEGSVYVAGQDAWSLSARRRANLRNEKIGFVFQFYHLLPELSALENAVLPAMIKLSRRAFRSTLKTV